MSTIKVVNIQHPDSVDPNLVLQADGDTVFASGLTVSGVFDIANDLTVSGNTGLGTSSPTSKLHVVDTTTNLQLESTANSSSGRIDFIGKDASSNSYRTLTIDTSSTGTLNIETDPDNGGYSTDKSILFKQAGTESMRIDTNGNVGIGRSSPGVKLDVSGDLVLNDASAVTNQKLAINQTIQSDSIVAILQNANTNFGDDANVNSLDIDLNYHGSTTFTGNRTHRGLYIDFDNNQTGHSGTSGNRLNSYGATILCDWNEGAHNSTTLRLASTVDKKVDGGTNAQEGIHNTVTYNNSFDATGITVPQNIKALHQDITFSSVNNSGVNIYGTDTAITIQGTETNTITSVYGHYTLLSTPTSATNYTINNSYGYYVQNDYDGISSYTNSYLFYGAYSTGALAALTGERRGIWITGATHNQITGKLLVGNVAINSYNADADNLLIGESTGGNAGLSIISGTTSKGNIYFGDSTGTTGEKVGRIVYDHNDNSLHFVTNDAEALRIDVNGNVGIGTSSPGGKLEVRAADATQTLNLVATENATDSGGSIHFYAANRSDAGEATAYIKSLLTNNNGGSGNVQLGDLVFGTQNTERMRIDEDGLVGIGTSSPAVALDVNGEIRASTGILFGTDTAAVNTLDDYEEGTYTPSFTLGSWTYTTQNGSYIKTGNKVTVWIRIAWSARPVGQNLICTLPFTSAAASAEYAGTVSDNGSKNFVTAENTLGCAVGNSSNELDLYTLKDANPRVIAGSSNFATSGTFTASVTYQTA